MIASPGVDVSRATARCEGLVAGSWLRTVGLASGAISFVLLTGCAGSGNRSRPVSLHGTISWGTQVFMADEAMSACAQSVSGLGQVVIKAPDGSTLGAGTIDTTTAISTSLTGVVSHCSTSWSAPPLPREQAFTVVVGTTSLVVNGSDASRPVVIDLH